MHVCAMNFEKLFKQSIYLMRVLDKNIDLAENEYLLNLL